MEKITKKYVEYLYPGFIFSDTSSEEIDHKDPTRVEDKKGAVAFRFYDQEYVIDGNKEFEGTVSNESNWFYYGERLSLAEVKERYGEDPDYKILIRNMENNSIEFVCLTRRGNFMPMRDGDMTIDEYIAEANRKKTPMEMFKKLKEHIGESVSVSGWHYGAKLEENGELRDVRYYGGVGLTSVWVPFIGYGAAITSITLDKTGEELYHNQYAEERYDRRADEDIDEIARMFYGDEITDKRVARREKREAARKIAEEEANARAKKNKYLFMRDGLLYIKEEMAEAWLELVDKNTDDAYSACIIETAIKCMKKLSESATCEEAEEFYDEMGLTGYMAGAVSHIIAEYSPRGEEFRSYWNKQFGISDETKGTVNPAVLVINKNE